MNARLCIFTQNLSANERHRITMANVPRGPCVGGKFGTAAPNLRHRQFNSLSRNDGNLPQFIKWRCSSSSGDGSTRDEGSVFYSGGSLCELSDVIVAC